MAVKNRITKVTIENNIRQTLEGRSLRKKIKFEKNPRVLIDYIEGT